MQRFIIILLAILLPTAPILLSYSRARWTLAYAQVELASERVDSAKEALKRSLTYDESVGLDLNYWRLQAEITLGRENVTEEELNEFVSKVVAYFAQVRAPSRQLEVAYYLGGLLTDNRHPDFAVDLMEKLFPPLERRSPTLNNQLAYARALAKKDLEVALREIDASLQSDPEEPAYLDTKGWILFMDEQYEPALAVANSSIANQYRAIELRSQSIYQALIRADASEEEPLEKSEPTIDPSDEPLFEAGKKLIAVLRYHRMRIAEKLGEEVQFQKDMHWLKAMGFRDLDSLQ